MKYSVSMKSNRDFRRLYAKGKSFATPTLAVYIRRTGRDHNQLGITVGTKVGKAVVRNSVRRKIREIYRLNEMKFPKGLDIVVVARVKSQYVDYFQLERDFLYACVRLGIIDTGAEK